MMTLCFSLYENKFSTFCNINSSGKSLSSFKKIMRWCAIAQISANDINNNIMWSTISKKLNPAGMSAFRTKRLKSMQVFLMISSLNLWLSNEMRNAVWAKRVHWVIEKTCVRANESGRRLFFLFRLSSAKKDERW